MFKQKIGYRAAIVILAMGSCVLCAKAQDAQNPSVAEAAKRSREQKQAAVKSSKVITDDDVDPQNVKPGAQGLDVGAAPKLETAPPPADAVVAAEAADQRPATSGVTAPKASDDGDIAALKEQIAEELKNVDVLKRDAALNQDTYFSNPDYAHDAAGKAKIDAIMQQVADELGKVDHMKAHLADMEERKAQSPANPNDQKPAVTPQL